MGSSKQKQTHDTSSSGTQQTVFDPRSAQEQDILNQYQTLGRTQQDFLRNLVAGGTSPFALNDADQAQLNQAYQSAFDRFNLQGKDYADYLAATRGMNKSDTPISQQALERYGLGMSDLLSQKANAGLNLGLQGTQMKLMGSQALPAGLGAAFSPLFSERMAGGKTYMTGNSRGTSTTVNTPSLMTQIGQGMGLGSQALGLGAQIGGLAMSLPGTGGMGSGAFANSWFGPGSYKLGGIPGLH